MGILDTEFDPTTQGLLAAAFAGLQASGPQRMPTSLGQIIGQAGSAGMAQYGQAMKEARQLQQAQQLIELEKVRGRLTAAQAAAAEQDLEDRKRWTSALSGGAVPSQTTGLLGTATAEPGMLSPSPTQAAAPGLIAPEQPNSNKALASKLRSQVSRYSDLFSSNPGLATTKQGQLLYAEISKLTEAANKLDPTETFHAPTAGLLPTGQPGFIMPGNRGTVKPLEGAVPLPQSEIVDLGGTKQVIDKLRTPVGTQFDVGVSPNTLATNAVTMRGQNMTDARMREQIAQGKISPPIEVSIDGKNTMVFQQKAGPSAGRVFDGAGNDVTEKISPQVKGSPLDPGRISMALQASSDLNQFENLVFPKDEKGKTTYNRAIVAAMGVPGTSGIGTQARMAYSAIENAVAAKLRGETGAATNPGEIENTANRFRPTMMDTEESARDKVNRLREFMGMTLDQLKESNHISQATYDKAKKNAGGRFSAGSIGGGWTAEKERRYQELKAKQNAAD